MSGSILKKGMSFLLAVLMLAGIIGAPTASFAADPESGKTETSEGAVASGLLTDEDTEGYYGYKYTASELLKLIGSDSYTEYDMKYEDVERGEKSVKVDATEYNAEKTTAKVAKTTAVDNDGVEKAALLTDDQGETTWTVNIPKTGRYAMRITYIGGPEDVDPNSLTGEETITSDGDAATTIYTTIERMLYIDGALPFSEARYFYFPRVWTYEYSYITRDDPKWSEYFDEDEEVALNYYYDEKSEQYVYDTEKGNLTRVFIKDGNGNDTRPRRIQDSTWQTYYLRDWLGYTIDPFEFYLTEGEHDITFVSSREQLIINEIEFYRYEEEPTYEEKLEEWKDAGIEEVTDVEPVKVQAEMPDNTSVQNVFPGTDRTSSLTEPQDPAVIKYNLLDNGTVGNWMRYNVTVEKSGLYAIDFRFRQNTLVGMFTSRRVRINGDIQFREASYIRFMYDTSFQTKQANNGEQEFLFYLEKGDNTIELEVVLGDMVDYVYEIEHTIEKLNDVYQKILMITGPIPDTYRDYGFGRLVPDCIKTISESAETLMGIRDDIVDITGEVGDQVNALENIAKLLETMATDEYEIAPNFLTFKNYIISLSDWLYAALSQPLKLDYFTVQAPSDPLPKAVSSFAERAWFEVCSFVASFSMDYTTVHFTGDSEREAEDTIEMWSTSDRETMLILRYLVDNNFTPETGTVLKIKVITAGLTEAILAGIGPDVSFMPVVDSITWGMREAVLPLENYSDFDEVMTWFPDAMKTQLSMEGTDGDFHTFGLPTTMLFPMAFYRLDILTETGLEPPQTWDDLITMMPLLLNNRLQIGLPTGLNGLELFLYQLDDTYDSEGNVDETATLYTDEGYRINTDSNVALSAFKSLCDMFQKYSSPVEYEITRFRTGEIPIMIQNDAITVYNQLMTFYELRGLWEMAPVIGTYNESTDSINRNGVATTQTMVIPRDGYDPEVVWEFMKWYVGDEGQTLLAKEQVAIAQPTSKASTANKTALLSQKWTDNERAAIETQLESLVGIPEYPGSYIVGTYVNFAFLEAYNNGTESSEAMLDVVLDINKEISRKRKEFGLDYYLVNYGSEYKKASEEN